MSYYLKKAGLAGVILSILFFIGCTGSQIESRSTFPVIGASERIAIYPLENFTDTPQAGMRAANIAEGILMARGFSVLSAVDERYRNSSLPQKRADARRKGASYLLTGGVSEWRYKTGIDGEPAVSLHLKLIDSRTGATLWSSTGSDSSWGNDSIGVLAQGLISRMLSAGPR